jgi:uncharacterized protein (TIGR00369 family)
MTRDSDRLDVPGPEMTDWGATTSKTMAWYNPMITAAAVTHLSGVEFLRAIRDGQLPPAPMAALFGFQMRDIEVGRVVFECLPDASTYNPIGVVHGGLVCTLADTVAACAVHSTLDKGVGYTSIDLNVSYLRPVTTDSGLLRATGLVSKRGRRVAFCTAEVVDDTGRLVATATSSCLVMDGGNGGAH